jgi:hypothetical protein
MEGRTSTSGSRKALVSAVLDPRCLHMGEEVRIKSAQQPDEPFLSCGNLRISNLLNGNCFAFSSHPCLESVKIDVYDWRDEEGDQL